MKKILVTIGHAELVNFPVLGIANIPARIDTGAKTSSIWASQVKEVNGQLEFVLFDKHSEFYTGDVITTSQYEVRRIISSIGAVEPRYVTKLSIVIEDRKIRASFTLANRARQTYPVLVGRNVLRGKFLIDVKQGQVFLKKQYKHVESKQRQSEES